jgi:stage II sporulation protein D
MKRSETNRALDILISGKGGEIKIAGKDLRRILGFDRLRSTNFIIKNNRKSTQFIGIGYGHGVGLCQWGTKKMAESGYTYRQIIQYYYPFGEIKKIY